LDDATHQGAFQVVIGFEQVVDFFGLNPQGFGGLGSPRPRFFYAAR
jgi:hypothetical protein